MSFSKKEEELGEMLSCPGCSERMTDPKILSCLHSFCETCLKSMAEQEESEKLQCSVCFTECTISKEGVSGIPRNTFLFETCNLLQDQKEVQCDICELKGAQNQAVSICLQCQDHLCGECSKFHGVTRSTASHHVVTLEEMRSESHFEEFWKSKKTLCDVHRDEAIKVYCENCQKAVCLLCKALDHNNHNIKSLDEATKKACDDLRRMMEPLKDAEEHSELLCEERNKVADSLDFLEREAISEVRQIFSRGKNRILADLETEEKAALDKLESEVDLARIPIEEARTKADDIRIKISSSLKYVEKVLESELSVQILNQFSMIKNRLQELKALDVATSFEKPIFSFHPLELNPDLSVAPLTAFQTQKLETTYTEMALTVPLASAVRLCYFGSQRQTEHQWNCLSLSTNDKWLVLADSYNSVKVFDKLTCRFVLQLEQEQERHTIENLSDVTCNDKAIFITDDNMCSVVKYDMQGRALKVAEEIYEGQGHIACNNNLIGVSDLTQGRILLLDLECNTKHVIDKTALGLDTFRPHKLCFNGSNQLLVIDEGYGKIQAINHKIPKVDHTYVYGNAVDTPTGICVDRWGNILLTDSCSDRKVVPSTSASTFGSQSSGFSFGKCTKVAKKEFSFPKDPIQNTGRVALVSNLTGKVAFPIQSGEVNKPSGITIFGPGEVAVLEKSGYIKIYKYLPN